MLAAVVRWSLANRPLVLAGAALMVALGLGAAAELPFDALPDLTPIQVQVVTTAPSLGPVEVEQHVTTPVERALASTPRSTEVRSLSKYGYSMVTVTFEDGTDIFRARQAVAERLAQTRGQISPRFGRPEVVAASSALGEIYQFVIENDRLSPMARRELLDWEIAPQLRSVPGVADVMGLGGESRQYQVVVEPRRLEASGVSLGEVLEAVRRANGLAGGGYIERDREQIIVATDGLVRSLDDLREVPLPRGGATIPLGSVADIRFGPALRRGAASRDGAGEVVVATVVMQLGENARAVTAAVKARVGEILPSLPEGTRIEPFYDRSVLVEGTMRTIAHNLLEGATLVVVVLLALLGELRAGLVVAAVIPLALLFAVSAMRRFDLSGNLMTLGAIDFGLLVDGALIIVENAVLRLDAAAAAGPLTPAARLTVVEAATTEVRAASVFGELIVAAVYLPILTLVGSEGRLFLPMASTVLLGLAGAFVLSLTLVPVLVSYLLEPVPGRREPRLQRWVERAYAPLLGAALRHPRATLAAALAAVAGGAVVFSQLGSEFVPRLDEGDVLVEVRRLPVAALGESLAMDRRVERALLELPEVEHVVGKLGAPEVSTDPMGINETDVYISLRPIEQWRPGVDKATLTAEISSRLLDAVPEAATDISQPIEMRTNELVAGLRSQVVAFVYGPDLDELAALGDTVASAIARVPGAVDVHAERVAGLRYLRVVPDRARLARHALSVADVNLAAATVAVGADAGIVLEGDRRFPLVVRTATTPGVDRIGALPLAHAGGATVPLDEVAELRLQEGPAEVNREGGGRRLAVEFNVRGRDLVSVASEARAEVERRVALPPGYRVVWGGELENYLHGRARLMVVVPITFGLIVLLAWMAFRSGWLAALVLVGVPFAMAGGVFALAARGIPFSISAAVGFIAVSGVAVLNALVLVSCARGLEASGLNAGEAMRRAAERRLRPVVMTALVAALGFVPMALSTAPGSEVQRPLATVVIGGVISAALLTLLVLPAIYARVGPHGRRS